jgi:hypothetical protein
MHRVLSASYDVAAVFTSNDEAEFAGFGMVSAF